MTEFLQSKDTNQRWNNKVSSLRMEQ